MKIERTDITARQAATIFADSYGDGRKIGLIGIGPELGHGIRFMFVDGRRWYAVKALPNYRGWEVVPEGAATEVGAA